MNAETTIPRWNRNLLIIQFFWGIVVGLLVIQLKGDPSQHDYSIIVSAIMVGVLPLEALKYLFESDFGRLSLQTLEQAIDNSSINAGHLFGHLDRQVDLIITTFNEKSCEIQATFERVNNESVQSSKQLQATVDQLELEIFDRISQLEQHITNTVVSRQPSGASFTEITSVGLDERMLSRDEALVRLHEALLRLQGRFSPERVSGQVLR